MESSDLAIDEIIIDLMIHNEIIFQFKKMKTILYKSSDRGTANYGWLQANYSFSFANYYNPEKLNFGALRVLNDDVIDGGMGFGAHPHDNMEIITIPLKGSLKHRDSMSNAWISLHTGEVQVMSAGTGIQHSEMNNHPNEAVNLFQIWVIPNKENVVPRYNQKAFDTIDRKNKIQTLVTSIDAADSNSLKIHQDVKISRIDMDENTSFEYHLKSENHGVYFMVINGDIKVENDILEKRDAMGVSQTKSILINATKNTELLFIEVPIQF